MMALDRETVVRAALRLLDEVGMEGLTLRRLATDLGVQAPALYWHFKNKQELLDEMGTAVLGDALREMGSTPPPATWQGYATAYARGLRAMLLRYRDGAKVFSGTYLTDDALFAAQEATLRVFVGAGFSPHGASYANGTLYSYTVGFAIEEQAVRPRPGEQNAQYDLDRRAARIDAARYPLALAAGAALFADFDTRFEYGLRAIVAGLERALADEPQPADQRPGDEVSGGD